MRVVQLFPLIAIGVCARCETSPPVQESALMRFLKRPFGLGRDNPTIEDPLARKPYSAKNDPLYLQTLNRSRARDGTLPREESALVKFLKHPFGLGHKDPVKEHIQEPFRKHIKNPADKHIKRPVERGIRKLEKDDPLNLKSFRRNSAQYGYRSMEESAPVKSSKHPFGFGRKDPVKEHITDPVKKNIVDPVKKNIGSPEDGIRHLDRDDPLNANDLDRNASQRGTVQVEKESSIARFFKHPFGLGSKDPVQEHIIDPIKEHVPDPKKDIRKLEQEDPLNLKPLKRKVTKKLTNEGWARGRDPEEHEKFLEIEETLMGTE